MHSPPLSYVLGYHFGQLLLPLLVIGLLALLLNLACPTRADAAQNPRLRIVG